MSALIKLLYGLIFLYLFYYFFGIPVNYTFRVKTIKDVGRVQSGSFYRETELRNELQRNYRGYTLAPDSFGWFPVNSGGLRGAVSVLYASFTEFLLLYHVEMDAIGSTGRHFMNASATVLQGQMVYSLESASIVPPVTLYAGDNYVLRIGQSARVKLSAGTTLLVYSRGFIPLTMGYWISETLFVDHDPMLALTTIFMFFKACAFSKGNIFYFLGQLIVRLIDYCLLLPQLLTDLYQTTAQYVSSLLKG